MKIFILGGTNIGPYHYSRFSALSRLENQFSYVTIPSTDVYRPWGADNPRPDFNIVKIPAIRKVWSVMRAHSPDVVITAGYANPALFLAALWAKHNSVPLILMNDSTVCDKKRRSIIEHLKSLLVGGLYAACFAAGKRSRDYAISLGINDDSIYSGVDVVDNAHFSSLETSGARPAATREACFLCVARLSPEKNIKTLLRAFMSYCESGGKWNLVIGGAGPQEGELISSVPAHLRTRVAWRGWVSYAELPRLYHNADCFVLPSLSEPWGLVMNEAMAAGLPVLVSNKCGSAPDLCKDGVNGYVFDPADITQLTEKMILMSSGRTDLKKMGAASKEIISIYTPEKWAEILLKICRKVLFKEG